MRTQAVWGVVAGVMWLFGGVGVASALADGGDSRFERGLRGTVLSVDRERKPAAVTIQLDEFGVPLALDVADDARIHVARQTVALDGVREGMFVCARLGDDRRTVVELAARGVETWGVVASVSPEERRLVLKLGEDEEEDEGEDREPIPEQAFELAEDVRVLIDGETGRLADVEPGMRLTVERVDEGSAVRGIEAEWRRDGDVSSEVRSVDAQTRTLTIVEEIDDAEQERSYAVAEDARVIINGEPGEVAALTAGSAITVRLRPGTNIIASLRARLAVPESDEREEMEGKDEPEDGGEREGEDEERNPGDAED